MFFEHVTQHQPFQCICMFPHDLAGSVRWTKTISKMKKNIIQGGVSGLTEIEVKTELQFSIFAHLLKFVHCEIL